MKAICFLLALSVFDPLFAQDVNHPAGTIFTENFSTNSNQWPISTDATVSYKLRDGRYAIENLNGQATMATTSIKNLPGEYTITANARHLGGITNNNFGLYFGAADNSNGYVFGITSGGSYIVFRYAGNKSEILVAWTISPTIKKGDAETNDLKVKASGNNFEFYINGTYVNSISGFAPYGSKVGFIVTQNQVVEFDDLVINSGGGSETGTLKKLALNDDKRKPSSDTTNFDDFLKDFSTHKKDSLFSFDDVDNFLYAGEKQLLADYFSTTAGWVFDPADFAFESGTLASKPNAGKTITAEKKVPLNSLRDYSVRINATHTSGVTATGYGLKIADTHHSILFKITGEGWYKITTDDREIKAWTKSEYLRVGKKATNLLEIDKTSTGTGFSLNGHLLYTWPDSVHFSPFLVKPFVDGAQTIAFNYLIVRGTDSPAATPGMEKNKVAENQIPYNKVTQTKPTATLEEELGLAFFEGFSGALVYKWNYDPAVTVIKEEHLTTNGVAGVAKIASWVPDIDTAEDYNVSIDVKHKAGADNSGYGLRFGTASDALTFEITSGGFYQVYDGAKALVAWVKTPTVKQADGSVNKLTLKKHYTFVEFFINDVMVYRYQKSINYSSPYIMLSVSNQQTVEFDNIEVDGTPIDDGLDWG